MVDSSNDSDSQIIFETFFFVNPSAAKMPFKTSLPSEFLEIHTPIVYNINISYTVKKRIVYYSFSLNNTSRTVTSVVFYWDFYILQFLKIIVYTLV